MQTVKVEYVWTKEKLAQAVKNHSNLSIRPWLKWVWHIFLLLLFLLFLWLQFVIKGEGMNRMSWLLICAGLSFYLWRQIQHSEWWITRKFDKSVGANARIVFEFTVEKIKIEMENLVSTEIVWSALIKVAESPQGFLLYHNNQLFHWVPFEFFEDEDNIWAFREMTINSGVKFNAAKI